MIRSKAAPVDRNPKLVKPLTVPPFMSTVVTIPKSATVLAAFVQLAAKDVMVRFAKVGLEAALTAWSNQSANVGLPESVMVLSASPGTKVKVFPAVKTEVVANLRSYAAPVDRTLRLVKESAVPPFISGVVKTGLASVPTEVIFGCAAVCRVPPRLVPKL